jgi:hypothetical protein
MIHWSSLEWVYLPDEKGQCFFVSSEPGSKAHFSWCTSFAGLPLVHVQGLKSASTISSPTLISTHDGVADAGGLGK